MIESQKKKLRLSPLPHQRADCPLNAFFHSVHDISHIRNLKICEACYCLICDIPASECSSWHIHCMGYYTHPDWRAVRGNKTAKIASCLLPPCVIASSDNTTFIDVMGPPNTSRDYQRPLVVRAVIDLESGENECGPHQEKPSPSKRTDFIDLDSENDVFMREIIEIEPAHLDLPVVAVLPQNETTANSEHSIAQNDSGTACNDVSTYEEVSTLQTVSQTDQQQAEEQASSLVISEMSPSMKELKALRQLWQVSRIYPSSKVFVPRCKQTQNTRTAEISTSFSSLFIGHIDMWRPYCSHMSALSIDFSCAQHQHDVASVLSPRQMRVPGAKTSHTAVLATEMGIDLPRTALIDESDISMTLNETLKGLQSFVDLSSVFFEDGTPMPRCIRDQLYVCIHEKLLAVQWELFHYPQAANHQKTFAHSQELFRNFDTETRAQILSEQLSWLKDCKARAERFESFNRTNCCLLRARVYLSPNVFSESVCKQPSYAIASVPEHMNLINASRCLAERCKSESTRKALMGVMSALKSDESTFMTPIRGPEFGRFSTILQASATRLSQPFHTLCPTYHPNFEDRNRDRNKQYVETLRSMSSRDDYASREKASILGILSSSTFTVSDGYNRSEEQPLGVELTLLPYQRETLAWMLDQEKARSISDPFWLSVHGLNEKGDNTPVYYCPLSGCFSKHPPPPVVGGVLAEEMGLGKTIIAISLILQTLEDARNSCKDRTSRRTDIVSSRCTLIICSTSLLDQWQVEINRHVSTELKIVCWYSKRIYDPEELAKNDIVLTTYGVLSRGYMNALLQIEWYRIILDECTEIKDPEFDRRRKHVELELISRRRWAVSGTPFGDNFKQAFFPIVRFLGVAPFSNKSVFRDISEVMTRSLSDSYLISSRVISKFIYLMKNTMIRHVKKQTFYGEPLIQLPTALGECVWVYMGSEEKEEYKAFESKFKSVMETCSNSFFGSEII